MSDELPIQGVPIEGSPLGWCNTQFDCGCGHLTIVTHPANMRPWNTCSKCGATMLVGMLLNRDGSPAEDGLA